MLAPKKILVCAGTRPEAIKLAPVILALRERPDEFNVRLCATGQHREMLRQAFYDFGITPDIDLQVMTPNQTLASLSARLFSELDALFVQETPDVVLMQGDTTTVMVAALCAFYRGITVGHVEAGLRSFNRQAPFPEEINRRIAGLTADIHFCPTGMAKDNLLREGTPEKDVYVTGNTVIDALLLMRDIVQKSPRPFPLEVERALAGGKRMVLVTGHRRESFGEGFQNICRAIRTLTEMHPETVFVYPVHLNPNVQRPVHEILGGCAGVVLTSPMAYREFVQLMVRSHVILSDSGGIQEEGPSLGKPVLIMREVTERPEGIKAGTSKLVGTDVATIVREVDRLLTDEEYHDSIARIQNPFGDGQAARRILEILRDRLA